MIIIGIIPARYASSRFPGKPLAKIASKTLIERVYRKAEQADLQKVIVATDDDRIQKEVISFRGNVVLTGEHNSGTDRIAEASAGIDCDAVINIQGDEPLIDPAIIDIISLSLKKYAWADMTTAASLINDEAEINDRNVVKTVFSSEGKALYFSRSRIPYNNNIKNSAVKYYKHIGIYGYRKSFLEKFIVMKSSPLETAESLEQLRALENGYAIHVSVVKYNGVAVDIPGDVERVEKILKENGEQ